MFRRSLMLAAWCACVACVMNAEAGILGHRPGYLADELSEVPNAQAVSRTIWVPGLDDGFVPQGLTFAQGKLLVSGYISMAARQNRGPCRIFSVDPDTGLLQGSFDMPEECGHAGGVVSVAPGLIVVSDTRTLYKIDLAKALASGQARDGIISIVSLAGKLKGSFINFDGNDLWIGASTQQERRAFVFRVSLSVFDHFNGAEIREDKALSATPIPLAGNGLAFDSHGGMWLSASNSRYGRLFRLDLATGAVLAQYDTVSGAEGLTFDEQGRMWSVSEAGCLRFLDWDVTYPVLFRLDVGKLK